MPLSDLITTSITLDTVRTARAGFGIPLILVAQGEAPAGFTNPTTYVGNDIPGDMVNDGWTTSDRAHVMATAMVTQEPRPRSVVVYERATPTAGVWQVDVDAAADDGDYTITIDGVDFTHAASSETATEIKDALVLLIPGASGLDITAATVDTDSLSLTADNAGQTFTITVTNANSNLTLSVTTPSVGADSDLVALQDIDDSWYCILETTRLDYNIKTIATYAETRTKIFIAQSSDADVLTSATDDVLSILQDLQRLRTGFVYHDSDAEARDTSWAGKMLPQDPGSATWAWQVVSGVPVPDPALTSAQIANIKAKNGNWCEDIAGRSTVLNGRTPGANFLDIVRGRDWIVVNLNLDIAEALQSADKIPMTQEGIEILRGIVEARLLLAAGQGIVTRESIVVDELLIDDDGSGAPFVSDTVKANRGPLPITFRATVQGAVHEVAISGTLSI
ncbi:MAG: DUF3383 domain-containing protein [bacterium]|nr:DUF3383 domain-containing protein [bacterium]